MERLKSVLADKIIDVSSESGDSSKANLEKLNRFRDFAFACEALMKKYPLIEDELIRMIGFNDFDTRVASSRVNKIIETMENGGGFQSELGSIRTVVSESPLDTTDAFIQQREDEPQVVNTVLVEDDATAPAEAVDVEEAGGGVKNNYTSSENLEFEYSTENKAKTNFNRALIVLAIVAGVVLAYFAIKFVFHNWRIILVVIGVIAAVGTLLWFVANKKNNNEIE